MLSQPSFRKPVSQGSSYLEMNKDISIDKRQVLDAVCEWLKLMKWSGVKTVYVSDSLLSRTAAGSMGNPLDDLRSVVLSCKRCSLHTRRKNVVFGEGNPRSRLMFIGEAPGEEEDKQGRPFVGRAGMLLTRIIGAMGLKREDVYITNVVKCRPPGNRNPAIDEIAECLPYLEKQVEVIKPEVICTLGLFATHAITGIRQPISQMRGRKYSYRGVVVIPTFHPAACLRNPSTKALVWQDIKKVMKELGLPVRGVMKHGASQNRH